MRINGPTRTNGTAAGNGSRRAEGQGFSVSTPAETREGGATRQAASLAGLDAVLALQEVEDATTGKRRRAVRRGNDMLDLLDDIRIAFLSGRIAPEKLKRLARLSGAAADTDEPALKAVLDEIELRAQVEIAKFRRSTP